MANTKTIDIAKDKNGNIKKTVSIGAQNTILNFKDTVKPELAYIRNKKDLIIKNEAGTFDVTIKNYWLDEVTKSTNSGLSTLRFTDITFLISSVIPNSGEDYTIKGKTLYGSAKNDSLQLTVDKAQTVYASFGNDTITASTGNDIIYTQAGNNTIKFSNAFAQDKLYSGTGTDTIVMDQYTEYAISKNGKNLILSRGEFTKEKEGSYVEIMDYLTKGSEGKIKVKVGNQTAKDLNDFIGTREIYPKINKSSTVKGTFLDEHIKGSDGNDKLYGVGGTNTLNGWGGKDSYYGGAGKDTFIYTSGQLTIYDATSKDVLEFYAAEIFNEVFNYDGGISKKGNDLFFTDGRAKNPWTITLKNYFKQQDRLDWLRYEGYDLQMSQNIEMTFDAKKEKTIDLGWKNMIVDFGYRDGYKAVFYEKSGNDIILHYMKRNIKNGTYSKINSVKVKDFFNANGSINLSKLKYKFDGTKLTVADELGTGQTIFNGISSTNYLLQQTTKDNTSITGTTYQNYVLGGGTNDTYTAGVSSKNLVNLGKGNDTATINNTGTNTFYYTAGSDKYISKGNATDYYHIGCWYDFFKRNYNYGAFKGNSSVYIKDSNGNNDMMYIASKAKDLTLLFNVNKDKQVITNSGHLAFSQGDGNWDSLMIVNKSAMTGKNISNMLKKQTLSGVIEIDDYFNGNNTGTGKIETIKARPKAGDENTINMTNWINKIKNDVGTWLSTNNYNDTLAVLNSGNQNDINALIKVYQGVTADEFTPAG